jgi:23S rRNA (uridine2552-2'-O)-methyltransferase
VSPVRKNPYARADARTLQARAEGYPARSVYKLKEIDQRCRILRAGQRVLDLGAAPGSWSLYASERVGATGKVLAVDLSKIDQGFPPNVTVLQADALKLDEQPLQAFLPFDVVLSDMAPKTSGAKSRDQALSFELSMAALDVALRFAGKDSHFVAKIFMSGDFPKAKQRVTQAYGSCRVIRPAGTRSISSEVFLVGLRRKAESAVGS